MLHDVKCLKDLEPVAKVLDCRRLSLDILDRNISRFLQSPWIALVNLPSYLNEELLVL
jgi:hypothetical protein